MGERVQLEIHVQAGPAEVCAVLQLDTVDLRDRGVAEPRVAVEREEELAP